MFRQILERLRCEEVARTCNEGELDGMLLGCSDGMLLGCSEGIELGIPDGIELGCDDGCVLTQL